MSQHDDLVRLRHMQDFAAPTLRLARGHQAPDLETDEMLLLALSRLLELVGEAALHVPEPLRERHAEVPWAAIIGMRHRLIHGYDFVDPTVLWHTVEQDLPPLIVLLNTILGDAEGNAPSDAM